VDSTLKQLETQLGGATALDTKLKQAGVTRAELTEFAHRLLVFQEVQKKVGEGQTSDAALHQSYEQNKLQFTNLHTWQILVKTQAQANKIAKQVTPKNFQTLADKYSIDPSVKQNHGDLGDSAASSLLAPYVQAALALNPGQISQPVQSQLGWHIIRLISSDVQSFDQVKSQLVQQSSGQAFQTWFQNQLTNAKISVNPRYGTFDPSTGTVNAATSTASGSQAPSPVTGGGSGAPAASPQGGSPTP
jgi:foldase protein PrsA